MTVTRRTPAGAGTTSRRLIRAQVKCLDLDQGLRARGHPSLTSTVGPPARQDRLLIGQGATE